VDRLMTIHPVTTRIGKCARKGHRPPNRFKVCTRCGKEVSLLEWLTRRAL
jgi:hypothetical protein